MSDKLTEMYNSWIAGHANPDEVTTFQAFQAGLSASAVSMRARAQACVKGKNLNDIKNAIGQLSDIPTE